MSARKHLLVLLALGATSTAHHADAAFPACAMVDKRPTTGPDPVNYVRMALRSDGRPAIVF